MNRHEVAAVMLVWISTYRSGGRYLRSVVVDMHRQGCGGGKKIWRVWLLALVWSELERDGA